MNWLDWSIIGFYMIGLIVLSIHLGKGQENQEDYYVGGRNLPWWAVGLSTMATQSSAISFISIPAFIALKPKGGLQILNNELALPLAMVFIMIFLIPFFRKLQLISIYEYLEGRFDSPTRSFLSAVFLISRGLATGVAIYTSAIVLQVCLGVEIWQTILLVGVVTVIYDTIGGMATVVYSDVIQMGVLLAGVFACVFYALKGAGGFSSAISAFQASRLNIIDFSTHGMGDKVEYPFWGTLIGGFFLYASYYGCDQSQVQRELSAPDTDATKNSLVFNGLFRFPLTLLYVAMGVSVGAFAATNEAFRASIGVKYDHMLPLFIKNHLPHGIKALIFAAILAAAMSSLDSALNSLSASTMRDFIEKFVIKKGSDKQYLLWGKITTVAWGILITASAFLFVKAGEKATVFVLINKIGSAFYGPILAAFLLGVATKRANGPGTIAGILLGVAFNIFLWIKAPTEVFWMWWNFLGCVITLVSGYFISFLFPAPTEQQIKKYVLWEDTELIADEKRWIPRYAMMVVYFLLMLAICYYLPGLLKNGGNIAAWLGFGG